MSEPGDDLRAAAKQLFFMSSTLKLLVNGETVEAPQATTVADLLKQIGAPRFVAVELNCDVVPRAKHAETELQDGDQIELVTLVGGG